MIPKFATWDETAIWLAKHGYGIEQIRLIKLTSANPEFVEKPAESDNKVEDKETKLESVEEVKKVLKAPAPKVIAPTKTI